MPALDALQRKLGDRDFAVVPISIDTDGIGAARRFYREIGIRDLGLYWGKICGYKWRWPHSACLQRC